MATSSPWTACRSTCSAASASDCSDRTARARRRPSRSSKGCSRRTRATWRCSGCGGSATSAQLRQRLGIQLQESQFIDKLTVEETLRLFRSFYDRGKTIDELLALVELESKRTSWVVKLSGGQKQRLVDRLRARRRSRSAVPRRADHRARSAVAPPAVGRAAALSQRRRHDPADDALHGRGRGALRSRRHRRSRARSSRSMRRRRWSTALGAPKVVVHEGTLEDVFMSLTGRHLRDE